MCSTRKVASLVPALCRQHGVPLGLRRCLTSASGIADVSSERLSPQHAADMHRLARRLRLGDNWQQQQPSSAAQAGVVEAYQALVAQGMLSANQAHSEAVKALALLPPALEPCREARQRWDVVQERLAAVAQAAEEQLQREQADLEAQTTRIQDLEFKAAGLGRLESARVALMDNCSERVAQAKAAVDRAHRDLVNHGPPPKLHPAGCYLHGPVGTGKSTMMDMMCLFGHYGFRLRRQHFHEFSLWLNEFLRKGGTDDVMRTECSLPLGSDGSEHKLSRIADLAAKDVDILCLDEFAVTNVADAAIFAEIFRLLAERYVCVVCTTNRPPEELYSQGLHREQHVPTLVDHLRQRFLVVTVDGPDYRQDMLRRDMQIAQDNSGEQSASDMTPVVFQGGNVESNLEAALARDPQGVPKLDPANIKVSWGRSIQVPLAGAGVACFHFDDLCRRALSADDFLYVAMEYHTILLHGIPLLSLEEHNEARRFTNLVDAAYEHSVRLICQSEFPIDGVLSSVENLLEVRGDGQDASRFGVYDSDMLDDTPFFQRDKCQELQDQRDAARMREEARRLGRMAAPQAAEGDTGSGWSPAPAAADLSAPQDGVAGVMVAAVGSLQESGFAARRAMSRLKEMRTAPYLEVSRQRQESMN